MHRRQFLNGLGAAGTALFLPACGGSSGPPAQGTPNTLQVIQASQGFVADAENWIALGILDRTSTPLDDAPVEVYIRTVPTGVDTEPEVVAGPIEMTWSDPAQVGAQGLYFARAELGEAGLYEFVAVTGEDHGTAAIQVVDPADSPVPAPGQDAIAAPTATTSDDLGNFALCTQDPPCGMHETSLDDALQSGQPIVLMFATPQFCQTAVCGPSVATLDEIRTSGDWGDTIFIHSEIFAEAPTSDNPAAAPVQEAVAEWGLPSEPWVFAIGADGTIIDRHDGAMPQEVLSDMATKASA